MILYHTSRQEIKSPDIHYGRKNADYGWGFYLTPDFEFACRWAGDEAVVNVYDFDESGLEIRHLVRNTEWFEYVFHNRRMRDDIKADVIIGPIANDTLFDTLGIISSGYLTSEDALRLLMIGPEYTQVAIKTEKGIGALRWLRTERVVYPDKEQLSKEREEYQELFAEELDKLSGDDNEVN